ncbi:unnamed protein product [Dicrocoelium dendriticum]|nr:unnamed protein product [Dicrocoelium dendriticum]
MWSLEEITKILEVFPEALNSDILIPRPSDTVHTTHVNKPVNKIYAKPDLANKKSANLTMSLVDPAWELIDPSPDIRALFSNFNAEYFDGSLGAVEVRWSPRMTLCAGLCCYEGRGGLCSIRLSEPLLKLRPRSDLIETLLHEMIHAYLFVTQKDRDRDGHGPSFQFHMNRINAATGAKITVYHTFHDEVANYQTHWWRCTGPCRERSPFYGFVKRAMNRAPGPSDSWWGRHQATCSGHFLKIKEPEKTLKTSRQVRGREKERHTDAPPRTTSSSITKFFLPNEVVPSTSTLPADFSHPSLGNQSTFGTDVFNPPNSHILGGSLPRHQSRLLSLCSTSSSQKPNEPIGLGTKIAATSHCSDALNMPIQTVTCPVCAVDVPSSTVNEHLDSCLLSSV